MSDSENPSNNSAPSSTTERRRSRRGSSTIADLELAFSQNPKSGDFETLCVAYLEAGRYMEAMVVCKKGLKTQPGSVSGQILLAKIYSAQKKYSRALKHLDGVIASAPGETKYLWARSEVRQQSGDEEGAVADLKLIYEKQPNDEKILGALREKGVEIAPPVAPVSPHMPTQPPAFPSGLPIPDVASGVPSQAAYPGSIPPVFPGSGTAAGSDSIAPSDPRYASFGPPSMSTPPPGYGSVAPMGRQKLEGEDELEALANEVATTGEKKGNPALSVALVFICLILVGGIVAYRFYEKNRTEEIAKLTVQGKRAEKQDTFRGYQSAAKTYERIIQEYDSKHPLTLGHLARVYAILWGEHGDFARVNELDQTLASAEKYAPNVSYTQAAKGLRRLYGNEDRVKGGQEAYESLRPYLKQVTEQGGEASIAEMTLGLAELEIGNYDRAVKHLIKVTKRQPSSIRARVLSARAYFRAGRLGKAEFHYTKALKMAGGGDHPTARIERALVRLQRGQLAQSDQDIKAFREFLRKYPKDVSEQNRALAEYARSEVLRAAGEDAAAEIAYKDAVEKDPKNADFPYGKGKWLLKLGRPEKAIVPLKQALSLEPNRPAFLVGVAEAEIAARKYDDALKRLEVVLKGNPSNIDALVVKGRMLAQQKSPEGAKFHEEFVKSSSEHVRALVQQAVYLRAMSDDKGALKSLEKAIENMTRYSTNVQAEVLMEYGKLKEKLGEELVAIKCFKKAAEFGQLDGWYQVIRTLSKLDAMQQADAKLACRNYLAAGTAQRHHERVRELCGLATPPSEQ